MAIYIPSFGLQHAKPGLNAPSGGSIAAAAAGQGIQEIAAGIAASNQQRQQLDSLAGALGETDPEIARLLQAQASSIPAISFGAAGGGGSRSGYGGAGGVGDDVFKFALKQADSSRREAAREALENLQHQNAMERIGVTFQNSQQSAAYRSGLEADLISLKDRLDETYDDPTAAANAEREIKVKEGMLAAENIRASTAQFSATVDGLAELRQGAEARADGIEFDYTLGPDGQSIISDPAASARNAARINDPSAVGLLDLPHTRIPARLGSTRLTSEFTHQQLADYYFDNKTIPAERQRINQNVIDYLVKKKVLNDIDFEAVANMDRDAGDDFLAEQAQLRTIAAQKWIREVPADRIDTTATASFDEFLGGLKELAKPSKVGDPEAEESRVEGSLFPPGTAY